MKVFCNDCDWVIAEDIDDAWKVWTEYCGEKREDYEVEDDEDFWWELSGDEEISIHDEDYLLASTRKKTCDEWIKEYDRGFLCSTEW